MRSLSVITSFPQAIITLVVQLQTTRCKEYTLYSELWAVGCTGISIGHYTLTNTYRPVSLWLSFSIWTQIPVSVSTIQVEKTLYIFGLSTFEANIYVYASSENDMHALQRTCNYVIYTPGGWGGKWKKTAGTIDGQFLTELKLLRVNSKVLVMPCLPPRCALVVPEHVCRALLDSWNCLHRSHRFSS